MKNIFKNQSIFSTFAIAMTIALASNTCETSAAHYTGLPYFLIK